MPRVEKLVAMGDKMGIVLDVPPESDGSIIILTPEELKAKIASAICDMLNPMPDEHVAMLAAAGTIPLERENGGLEYPPFKVFNAMLRAYAKANDISL